jgi:hypothetical protein
MIWLCSTIADDEDQLLQNIKHKTFQPAHTNLFRKVIQSQDEKLSGQDLAQLHLGLVIAAWFGNCSLVWQLHACHRHL